MVRIPTHREPTHPGETLLEEFLHPMGLTQRELADGSLSRAARGIGRARTHRARTSRIVFLARADGSAGDTCLRMVFADRQSARSVMLEVGGDYVLGQTRDAQDVIRVVMYRLLKRRSFDEKVHA